MKLRPLYVAAGLVLAVMLAVSIWAWPQIPDDALIPTHWNAAGEADGFSSKPFGLFGLPAVCAGVTLLLAVLPRVEPRRQNLEKSARAYIAIGMATLLLMAAIHVAAVLSTVGVDVNVSSVSVVTLSVLLCVMGVALRRVRSSWLFGIRTPWTLTSERSWKRTHEVGSVVFLVVGIASLLVALAADPSVALWAQLGAIGVGVVGLVVYSYLVWRNDPHRTEPPPTSDETLDVG
ncbi:MAG TPA: DUF1648 domain-containing protein [Acidimicrobiia bacterium]|jgi:uncharacterized membrane protein